MTGAIIGDLAAWTWKYDRDAFYPQLVSDKAECSAWGKMLLTAGKILFRDQNISREIYKQSFTFTNGLEQQIGAVMRVIPVAWLYDTEKEVTNAAQIYSLKMDKEDWYASHFMAKLIFALRKGATKKEAAMVEHIGTFRSFTKETHWKQSNGVLGMLIRAWMAFYDSFDFTSALHNAMKLPGNRHVNGILVGALAGAMYGCSFRILKKKYTSDNTAFKYIELPTVIKEQLSDWKDYQRQKRIFFCKNDAMTNVELHPWLSANIPEPYTKRLINKELYRRILKAFTTSWDCRYGFYLDDGRIYIYRSGFLLCRFRLNIGEPIADFQIAADAQQNAAIIAFENAMESVEHRWYLVADSDEERPANLKHCKYYQGETECPKQFQNTIAAKFWHGEMMFIVHQLDLNHWKQIAMHTKENLNEDQLQFISQYSEEQFAIILYIEELYSKWCPYDNLEWIYQY